VSLELELTLARLREAADLYRQIAKARRDQSEGQRREISLTALDAEYQDDLAADEKQVRARKVEAGRLEDALQALEAKLQDRRSRHPSDAATVLAMSNEISLLKKQRDQLEQQLLNLWQDNEKADSVSAQERKAAEIVRGRLADRREDFAAKAAQADRAVPEIQGELEHLLKQIPVRVSRRVSRLGTQHDEPIADLITGSCGCCGYRMTPQEALDADREAALITCQGCGRYVVARSSRKTRGWE